MFLDLLIAVFASITGILCLIVAIVTLRALVSGASAYEANRRVTHRSVWKTFIGDMKGKEFDKSRRTSHGLAIHLKTKELRAQKKLSSEAIDDVIARRV